MRQDRFPPGWMKNGCGRCSHTTKNNRRRSRGRRRGGDCRATQTVMRCPRTGTGHSGADCETPRIKAPEGQRPARTRVCSRPFQRRLTPSVRFIHMASRSVGNEGNARRKIMWWCSAVRFIVTLALSLLVAPLVAETQPRARVPRIGYIGDTPGPYAEASPGPARARPY